MLIITHVAHIHRVRGDSVLHVVHAVSDVIRQVHDLCFEAAPPGGHIATHPGEHLSVVFIDAKLLHRLVRVGALAALPRILRDGVQRRPRQIQSRGCPVRGDNFGFEAHHNAQCLSVSLKASGILRQVVEHAFAVVTERRVAQIVRQARCLHNVWICAKFFTKLATHLCHFQ